MPCFYFHEEEHQYYLTVPEVKTQAISPLIYMYIDVHIYIYIHTLNPALSFCHCSHNKQCIF